MNPQTHALTLDDLMALDGRAVAERNADLLHLSRREFNCAGLVLRFERRFAAQSSQRAGDVWLALVHAGLPLRLRVSQQWAESLAAGVGVSLQGLDRNKLELLCLTRLAPHLPRTVQFQACAYAPADLPVLGDDVVNHGTWAGLHSATGEPSGHEVQIEAASTFPVYAFLASFDPYLQRMLPPPLARLPLTMPLLGARWTVDAGDLDGLEVGDVLLIA